MATVDHRDPNIAALQTWATTRKTEERQGTWRKVRLKVEGRGDHKQLRMVRESVWDKLFGIQALEAKSLGRVVNFIHENEQKFTVEDAKAPLALLWEKCAERDTKSHKGTKSLSSLLDPLVQSRPTSTTAPATPKVTLVEAAQKPAETKKEELWYIPNVRCAGIENPKAVCCSLIAIVKVLWAAPGFRMQLNQVPPGNRMADALKVLFTKLDEDKGQALVELKEGDNPILDSDGKPRLGLQPLASTDRALVDVMAAIKEMIGERNVNWERQNDPDEIRDWIMTAIGEAYAPTLQAIGEAYAPTLQALVKPKDSTEHASEMIVYVAGKTGEKGIQQYFDEGVALEGVETPVKYELDPTTAGAKTLFVKIQRFFKPPDDHEIINAMDEENRNKLPNKGTEDYRIAMDRLKARYGLRHDETPILPPAFLYPNGSGEPPAYRLRSVEVHVGNFANTGHHKSFVPHFQGDEKDLPTTWYSHDDSVVSPLNFVDLQNFLAKNSYLFTYERVEEPQQAAPPT